MSYISVGKENGADIRLFYKDWGTGKTVVFSHGWPLTADAWEDQMLFLSNHGFRCIAHDRRGNGRSSQPGIGNNMDTFADDLAQLIEALDLKDIILVGHSTGGGEITRYMSRHGTKRIKKAVLISAIPPLMLKTETNPNGLPVEVFNEFRNNMLKDRAHFFKEITEQFYGANRPNSNVSQGLKDSFWLQGMISGFKSVFDCIKEFSESDFREDLKKIDVPTLIIQGDDDQIVPFAISGALTSKIIKNAVLKVYPGAPHGLCSTHKDKVNADLLEFLKK
ncbi:MAG: alpha/beta hydrolase [Candidatus Babeliaceae bacterium]|nr:alpha/beta hydrolase [Candidatus Babeliaceae bacterium]